MHRWLYSTSSIQKFKILHSDYIYSRCVPGGTFFSTRQTVATAGIFSRFSGALLMLLDSETRLVDAYIHKWKRRTQRTSCEPRAQTVLKSVPRTQGTNHTKVRRAGKTDRVVREPCRGTYVPHTMNEINLNYYPISLILKIWPGLCPFRPGEGAN